VNGASHNLILFPNKLFNKRISSLFSRAAGCEADVLTTGWLRAARVRCGFEGFESGVRTIRATTVSCPAVRTAYRRNASLQGAARNSCPFDISSVAQLDVGGRTPVVVGALDAAWGGEGAAHTDTGLYTTFSFPVARWTRVTNREIRRSGKGLGLNLGRVTGYPGRGYSWFSSVLRGKFSG
jgi:hypothetical protein